MKNRREMAMSNNKPVWRMREREKERERKGEREGETERERERKGEREGEREREQLTISCTNHLVRYNES